MDENSRLRTFIDALIQEHWRAIRGLAIVTVLRSSVSVCPRSWQGNGFLPGIYETSVDSMFLTLARMLEDGGRGESVTIIEVCNYAEQNSAECVWLFTEAGRAAFPSGVEEIKRRCTFWRQWVAEHPIGQNLKMLRDKALAHRDKKHVLGESQVEPFDRAMVENVIREIGKFIDDFMQLINNSEVAGWSLYEETIDNGAAFLAVEEAMWSRLSEHRADRLWPQEVGPHVHAIRLAVQELTTPP